MARRARFEIVRTDAGWHARFIAGNGQIVWVTESYTKRVRCLRAIDLITGSVVGGRDGDLAVAQNMRTREVREVDERGAR